MMDPLQLVANPNVEEELEVNSDVDLESRYSVIIHHNVMSELKT